MFRPALFRPGILGLFLAAAAALSARPGETLEQITKRLGPPASVAGNLARWELPDGTVLNVILDKTRPGDFSMGECLAANPARQPLDPEKITRFLRDQAADGITWVRSKGTVTIPQPYLDLPGARSLVSVSSDGALFAFFTPEEKPSAVLVAPVPADLAPSVREGLAGNFTKVAGKTGSRVAGISPAAGGAPPVRPSAAPPAPVNPPARATLRWRWPEVESDLPPDPGVSRGRLPNGVRYAIMPNAEPKGRVSLRLLVATGSLYERDDERGIAHFVEHMVFLGTKSHPGDSLARELQRLGLAIGAHNTAFTSYDSTTFHLELPATDDAMLRRCLQALREYAAEATFAEEAMTRERGVVLNEWAARADSGFFAGCANTAFLWPRSRRAERVPIGLTQTIQACTRKQLVAFYRAWYRPERFAVIVVGDVPRERAEALVREVFGPVKPHGRARDEPSDLIPVAASNPNVLVFSDASQTGVACLFEHPQPFPREADTPARRTEALRAGLAFAMFQARLEKYAAQYPGAFVNPRAEIDYGAPGWRTAILTAAGRLDSWRQMVGALEREHRRAFQQGFSEDELRIARANSANGFEESVRSAATRPSGWLADALVSCLRYGLVFPTPGTVRDDLAPALAATTAAECTAAFRRCWTQAAPHVFLAAERGIPVDASGVTAVLNDSRKQATQDPGRKSAATFGYTDFGPPGALVRDDTLADLDVHLAEFANGVRLNFKRTAFVADWVEIRVRVGTGQLGQPASPPGLGLFANFAFAAGGLGRHSVQDLDDLLAGHSVNVQFGVATDAFVFDSNCARRDLLPGLQLITAYLTDAAYRPEALDVVRARISAMYSGLAESAGHPITMLSGRILAGGDRRFGMPAFDEVIALNMASLAGWLGPELKNGSIEMSVVGDASWEEVRAAVARTLGALPRRPPRTAAAEDARVRSPEPPADPWRFSTPPTGRQVALAWAWAVPDLASIQQERRFDLLAGVVADRLRARLREQLGATYAPSAGFTSNEGFPSYSYLMAYAEVLPADAIRADALVRATIEDLRTNPLGADEFARVMQPFLRARDDNLRTNPYWCITVLSDAQERPQRIGAARDRAVDSASITPAEIQALARRYLTPGRMFHFVATPSAR